MSQKRCYTCLQLDRKLSPLKAQVKFLFAFLCPEMFIKNNDTAQYLICWECEFMADKIKRFQTRLKKANEILKLSFKGKTTIFEGVSCLEVTAVETISFEPQSTPILPQNDEPMLSLNVPMLPKIVPKVPQNILQLSLKDMLAIPIKLDTQDEVKIEEDEDEQCNDYDRIIQPNTIMHVPMGQSDQLLIPRLNQPAEIVEVSPHKPVKDEIIDPAINYKPQKVFIDAPKFEVELRGLGEAVKVTPEDPNLVMGLHAVLVNKDKAPVKCKKSEILAKLLSTPSKCEELFSKRQCVQNSKLEPECSERSVINRQRVPNSNPANESICSEQSSAVACGEEVKLIILNRTELNARRDKKRLNPAYLVSSHKCERCIEWFSSQDKLDEHNLKHDDMSRGHSICEICEQSFANDSLRNEHHRQHFIVYQCNKCPCKYSSRLQLTLHCRRKHEESTFVCRKCFKIFKTYKERRRHIFQTHNQRQCCEECGKTFSSAHMLKNHVSNIHKSKPVECPICKKMIKNYSLKVHMKIHNRKSEDGVYCVDCDTTYKTKYIYAYHLKTSLKHNTLEKLGLKCDHCDKYFASKDSLKNHTEEIGGVKYTCDICDKVCKTKKNLARHILFIHEGKKQKKKLLVCEVCGKSFTVKKSLREHLNIHLGIRPHVCDDCGATFTYSAALFTHRRLKHKVMRKFEMTS